MFHHLQKFPMAFQSKLPLGGPNAYLIQQRCPPFMKSRKEMLKAKQFGKRGEQEFSLEKAKPFHSSKSIL